MKTKIALLTLLTLVPSLAAALTFQFDTTLDTTRFGGAPGTPLSVTYTFDPTLPNDASDPNLGLYTPLTMEIRLGIEVIVQEQDA